MRLDPDFLSAAYGFVKISYRRTSTFEKLDGCNFFFFEVDFCDVVLHILNLANLQYNMFEICRMKLLKPQFLFLSISV